jgi:hypothetical protein
VPSARKYTVEVPLIDPAPANLRVTSERRLVTFCDSKVIGPSAITVYEPDQDRPWESEPVRFGKLYCVPVAVPR